LEKLGRPVINPNIKFNMKIIKFNNKKFSKDLDFISKDRRSNFSTKANIVRKILKDVKSKGDSAIVYYQKKFDKSSVSRNNLILSDKEADKITKNLDSSVKKSIKLAFDRVKDFHKRQFIKSYKYSDQYKNELSYKVTALDRVGIYIPGGTASYPSSVIMNAVPAIIAGVKNITLCMPTPNNKINAGVVYAAKICGVKKIYKIGGAQAIGAFAYGTKTVHKVDKIVGPGNIFVTAAKKEVFGEVGIDMVAGPSEITIVANEENDSTFTAIDLLSQAEHDELSQAILVTTNFKFGLEVREKVYKFLDVLPRKKIAKKAIYNNSAIIVCKNFKEVVSAVNEIAPEHLEIKTKNNSQLLKKIKNAGSIFLGENSPEAIGDYLAGPNHVLPTAGSARFASGLSVYDFYKKTSVIKMSKQGLEKIGRSAIQLADYEGLFAHSQSIRIRIS
jgi:histidinol dehydrogenase